MKKIISTSIFSLFIGASLFSQENPEKLGCATYSQLEKMFQTYPELEDAYYAYELLQNSKKGGVNSEGKNIGQQVVIPVVVHILHQYGAENINDSKVYDLMDDLNREFNAEDADSADLIAEYQDLHGNAGISFVLAAKDPYGNCTNGIEHIYSHESFVGDSYSKINQWDRSHYLNIWVVDVVGTPGAAAYATPPGGVVGSGFWVDGVLTQYSYVGGAPAIESVITHEVGHYFNLKHVWGDLDLINNPPSVCGDDGVDDTPYTMGWTNCPLGTYPDGLVTCDPYDMPVLENVFAFDSITTTSGTTDPTPVPDPQASVAGITSVLYTSFQAVGVGANPTTTGSFGFNSWDTGAADGETVYTNLSGSINTAKYYQFSVAPESRGRLDLQQLLFSVDRDAEGPRTFAVRWDVDGYAANLDLTATSSTNADITVDDVADIFFYTYDSTYTESGFNVDLTGNVVAPTNPTTFRIYAWNSENASGDFIVDDVQVVSQLRLIEDVQNYMEYAYCDRHFTPGQVERMHNALLDPTTAQRQILWQDTTLISTGVFGITLPQVPTNDINNLTVPLCVPVADFYSADKTVCVGSLASFEDASWNAVVADLLWEFEGGTPATSTASNPSVSWSTPGYKQVKLTASNAAGSDTRTETHYIFVAPNWPDFTGPKTFNMESNTNLFLVENPEDNYGKFAVVNTNSDQGKAFKLQTYKDVSQADLWTNDYFYNARLGLSEDILISPAVDLRNTTGITISFKYSYATNATLEADITEQMKVYTSRDCGETWQTKSVSIDFGPAMTTITGDDLVTAGYASNADFTPNAAAQWRTGRFTYTPNSQDNKTRIKFEFIASDLASNLFIDDIMIEGVLSIADETIVDMDLVVFPNPTSGEAINVSYNAQNEPTEFILRDVQGKIIAQETISITNAQVSQALMGTENLAASYYFLEVRTGSSSTTKKIAVL